MNASLSEIAMLVDGKLIGDGKTIISSLAPINEINLGSLVFVDSQNNLNLAQDSNAAAILVPNNLQTETKPIIQVPHPLKAFIQLLNHFYPRKKPKPFIHPTAIIAEDVLLGQNVFIGPYVVIEAGATIGNNCIIKSHVHIGEAVTIGSDTLIHSQVTIYDQCQIGSRVSIHASSVIGSDGFGYTFSDNHHLKVPHLGKVIIGDDVEIGANTVIDRATLGATVIGEGSKIDNLVQIAHGVKLGKHNIICAFTGIAGSTTSGDNVTFAAKVGVSDHVTIEDRVTLGASANVPPGKHLKEGLVYLGSPARPRKRAIEQELSVARIPIMRKHLKDLSEKVKQLAEHFADQETD